MKKEKNAGQFEKDGSMGSETKRQRDQEKTMKVLYLLHTTNYDGSNISLINLMTSLHEKGVTIYVVHPDSEINSTFYKKTHDILEKAQKTAVQLFSIEQSGDSVYSFYQEVLSG